MSTDEQKNSNKKPINKLLSPRRNTSKATTTPELVNEQLEHFGIDKNSEFGQSLASIADHLYHCQDDINKIWEITQKTIQQIPTEDRIAHFNAKKFLCFQLAKLLDELQAPFRRNYQSLGYDESTLSAKGAYPIFDNVTAIFSATPTIARTATYIYACAEWIEDAFKGKELMLEIYSRLLNPTSLALANHIVDLEAGPYASEYLAWNYNSGMAAIDAGLSHVLGREDILITSGHIYGGAHQLIHDWFAKPSNLNIGVETFHGETAADFYNCLQMTKSKYHERLTTNPYVNIYVYLESPCNPHGYVLDVPGICKAAHEHGLRVILDSTVGTPFLSQPLERIDLAERPDFVIHSYTKDLAGSGSVIAGCVIARNEDMFISKGEPGWDKTMFWNVYYIKGAFLNADAAFEVMQGMKTLALRMLAKSINTTILAKFLDSHPQIQVTSNCLPNNSNYALKEKVNFLGFTAPLFTIAMDAIPKEAFQRFFDCLEPTFAHMITLGQTNSIVSCPGLTTHSELSADQLIEAGISPHTIRFAVGLESPNDLLRHLVSAAKLAIDPLVPHFSQQFMPREQAKKLIQETYVSHHDRYISARIADL